MSRTKRRKNVSIPDYRLMDYVFDDVEGFWKHVPYSDKEFKLILVKHHSDSGFYVDQMPVPKPYLQVLNRIFRAKMKHEVNRIFLMEDYDEYEFTPHKRDAAYIYW